MWQDAANSGNAPNGIWPRPVVDEREELLPPTVRWSHGNLGPLRVEHPQGI